MTCCALVQITQCLFFFFPVNSHLERQCVFVKLIVIHLFTSLVNKWDHYSVGGVSKKKKKSLDPGASTKSFSFAGKLVLVSLVVVLSPWLRRNKSAAVKISGQRPERFCINHQEEKRPNEAETMFLSSAHHERLIAGTHDDVALFFSFLFFIL